MCLCSDGEAGATYNVPFSSLSRPGDLMGSQHPYIQQLRALDRTSPQVPDQLSALFDEEKYRDNISSLPDQEAVWLVECLEDVCVPNPYLNNIY